jgi:hypothetical protein
VIRVQAVIFLNGVGGGIASCQGRRAGSECIERQLLFFSVQVVDELDDLVSGVGAALGPHLRIRDGVPTTAFLARSKFPFQAI